MDVSQAGADLSRELRELAEAVRDLQHRVAALEQRAPAPVSTAPAPPLRDLRVSSDVVPTIGRALLAIAGAYLLRALTEWKILPLRAGVILGILYAGFWLWHAARAPKKLAAMVNAATSAFIFAPLAWEATVNLHAIPTWASAGTIGIFSIAALRRREVAAIASAAGAAIAIVLLLATHDLLPFTLALVAIAAAAEWAMLPACWVSALCVDAAAAILAIIVAAPLPEGYAAITKPEAVAIQAALLALFAGAAAVRRFGIYEIAQTAVVFLLSIGGAWYVTRASGIIGAVTLALAAVCYIAVLLKTKSEQVYAAFAGLLALTGILLIFSGALLVVALLAIGAALAWTPLGTVQAPAFLWAAMLFSGLAAASGLRLFAGATDFPRAIAVMCAVAGALVFLKSGHWIAALLAGAAALWALAGFAASFGAGPVVLTLFAAVAGWSGARWKRQELIWLMYALMIVSGLKILFHDFARESAVTLMTGLLVYGAALIALPRVLQKR